MLSESTLQRLLDLVMKQLDQFDSEVPGFTAQARKEAKALEYDWHRYLSLAIQHQICMRMEDSVAKGVCWKGAGDKIHSFMKGVDKVVDATPTFVKRLGIGITKAATKLTTGESQEKFGGCPTCGGRRTFSGRKRNLGRAAKLNKP